MKKWTLALLGATTALALSGGTAMADTVTSRIWDAVHVGPTYSRVESWSGNNSSNNWVDEIGGGGPFDGFRSGAIDVIWGRNDTTHAIESVKFILYTNFGLSGLTVNNGFAGFADLFIDINDGKIGSGATIDWDYALDFKSGSENETGDLDGASAQAARLVTTPTYSTSQDLFSNVNNANYGGMTNICNGSDANCDNGSRKAETKVTNGTGDFGLTVTDESGLGTVKLTGPNGSEDYYLAYSVMLKGIDFTGWETMRLFWGTGFCANDTIEGVAKIPVPAALPIIGAALAGFGFAGWRQRKAA